MGKMKKKQQQKIGQKQSFFNLLENLVIDFFSIWFL